MNLVTELNRIARNNYNSQLKEAEKVLESVKANLQMEDKKDAELLKLFGTKEVAESQTFQIQKIKEIVAGNWLTKEDIRKVCLRYNLRFLPSRHYRKEIPLKALNDLRNYREQNNISSFDNNLYLIAPASHFTLGERPAKDPVLIHQIGSRYKIVSTWGDDFSFIRRIKGIVAYSPAATILFSFIALLTLIGVGGWLLFNNTSWLFAYLAIIPFLVVFGGIAEDINSSDSYWHMPYKS